MTDAPWQIDWPAESPRTPVLDADGWDHEHGDACEPDNCERPTDAR